MPLSYLHYDVFTDKPLLGNQLAVFTDAQALDGARMQAIAREMNFSESTFILPNERPDTDIRMRIFTPFNEMPMAGHPTIGSTFALAHTGVIKKTAKRFVFGLNIGPTPVALEWAPYPALSNDRCGDQGMQDPGIVGPDGVRGSDDAQLVIGGNR